jgi:hypothetical protein
MMGWKLCTAISDETDTKETIEEGEEYKSWHG